MDISAGEITGSKWQPWDPDINVNDQAENKGQKFATAQKALDYIASLPPSDKDFAVLPNTKGSGFKVHEILKDLVHDVVGGFKPDSAYHGQLIRNTEADAVAVVFRDVVSNVGHDQVITENGTSAVVTDDRATTHTPPKLMMS